AGYLREKIVAGRAGLRERFSAAVPVVADRGGGEESRRAALQARECLAHERRAGHATLADTLLLRRGPAPEDVFAREVNDGVHAFEAGAIDCTAPGIPGDDVLTRLRLPADERHDVVAALLEGAAQ